MNLRVLRLAGCALLILVGVWAGVRVYSHRALVTGPGGGVLVPMEALAPALKIPDYLPDFSLTDSLGLQRSIATWQGKSLVLNFWATWCAPCRREIPLLKALHEEWAGRDVAVVGIAVDYREQVLKFAHDLQISYPLLMGEQDALDVAAAFGVQSPAFPFTVFTDRRGQVVALYMGELHRPQAELILSVVQKLNLDRMALGAARRGIAEGLQALTGATPG